MKGQDKKKETKKPKAAKGANAKKAPAGKSKG